MLKMTEITKGKIEIVTVKIGALASSTVCHVYWNSVDGMIYVCKSFYSLGSFQYACVFRKEYNQTHKGDESILEFTDKGKALNFINGLLKEKTKGIK